MGLGLQGNSLIPAAVAEVRAGGGWDQRGHSGGDRSGQILGICL